MFSKQACLAVVSALALALVAGCASQAKQSQPPPQDAIAAQAADKAFRQNRFQDAVDSYNLAIAASADPAAIAKYKIALAKVYREWALLIARINQDATTADDCRQAIAFCFAAIELDPENSARYEGMIAKFQAKISALKYKASVAEQTLFPYDRPRHEQVEVYLTQARAYAKAGEYDKAMRHLEKAMKVDPTNAEVALEMSKVGARLNAGAAALRAADAPAAAASVVWKNLEPAKPQFQETTAADAAKLLKETFITKLDLKNATLRDAFAKLTPPNGSIIYSFDGFDPDAKDLPLVNFKSDGISLDDALRSLCPAVGLTYSVEANGRVSIKKK